MQVFINECSLHGQYVNMVEFEQSVRQISSLIYELQNELQLLKVGEAGQVLLSKENIKYVVAIRSQIFVTSLNNLSDKSLYQAFVGLLFNRLNARDWQDDRLHSPDDIFMCIHELVTDTSVAEIAERLLQVENFTGLLLNFYKSKFDGLPQIDVMKNETTTITIDCVDNKSALQQWLEITLQLSHYSYGLDSQIPPTDEQTVLHDVTRFKPSSLPIQSGRKVYHEIQTNLYWYVDNFHYGRSAHLEVFDLRGRHIGEANLDGEIDQSKRDLQKRIQT